MLPLTVAQAWAVGGVAAAVRRENGSIAEARVGLTNMGSTPVRASAVEAALSGADASAEASSSPGEANGSVGSEVGISPTLAVVAALAFGIQPAAAWGRGGGNRVR